MPHQKDAIIEEFAKCGPVVQVELGSTNSNSVIITYFYLHKRVNKAVTVIPNQQHALCVLME